MALEGASEAELAKLREDWPTIELDGAIQDWAAHRVALVASGSAPPANLRLSLHRWLQVEAQRVAEGRSRRVAGGTVQATDGAPDAKTAPHRIDLGEPWGSWPVDRRGWDADRDGGEHFWLDRKASQGEHFYLGPDGRVRPIGDNEIERKALRRATLEEILTFFRERDPNDAKRFARRLAEIHSARSVALLERFGWGDAAQESDSGSGAATGLSGALNAEGGSEPEEQSDGRITTGKILRGLRRA